MTGKRNADGLTDAQRRFAEEYLVDFNASAAYLRAGYKGRGESVRKAASNLLGKDHVQGYLRERQLVLLAKLEVSQEEVLRRVACLGLGDFRKLFDEKGCLRPLHELTVEEASMIAGIEVKEFHVETPDGAPTCMGYIKKIKRVDPLGSLRTLGGHFGLFAKRVMNTDPKTDAAGKTKATLEDLMDAIDGAGTGLPKPLRRDVVRSS